MKFYVVAFPLERVQDLWLAVDEPSIYSDPSPFEGEVVYMSRSLADAARFIEEQTDTEFYYEIR